MWESMVEAEEIAGFIQGQQIEHAATVVPSVKREGVLPMGKLARIVTTRTIWLSVDFLNNRTNYC